MHRHHSPSPSWVFVSSQSKRNKMAEERAHTTLIPFPPPSEMPWGTSKLDQGGVNPGAWRNLSSLRSTLPLTPYTASLSEEFHSSLFLTDRLALAQRLPARGTRRWAGVKHKILWHYVSSMYTRKYKHSLTVLITRPRGSCSLAGHVIQAANVNKQVFNRIA